MTGTSKSPVDAVITIYLEQVSFKKLKILKDLKCVLLEVNLYI